MKFILLQIFTCVANIQGFFFVDGGDKYSLRVFKNTKHWLFLMYVKAFCHRVLHFFEFGKQDSMFYTTLLWGPKMKNIWWSLLILNGKYITVFFFSLFKVLQDPVIISWDYHYNIIMNIWFCLIHEFHIADVNVISLELH